METFVLLTKIYHHPHKQKTPIHLRYATLDKLAGLDY